MTTIPQSGDLFTTITEERGQPGTALTSVAVFSRVERSLLELKQSGSYSFTGSRVRAKWARNKIACPRNGQSQKILRETRRPNAKTGTMQVPVSC